MLKQYTHKLKIIFEDDGQSDPACPCPPWKRVNSQEWQNLIKYWLDKKTKKNAQQMFEAQQAVKNKSHYGRIGVAEREKTFVSDFSSWAEVALRFCSWLYHFLWWSFTFYLCRLYLHRSSLRHSVDVILACYNHETVSLFSWYIFGPSLAPLWHSIIRSSQKRKKVTQRHTLCNCPRLHCIFCLHF